MTGYREERRQHISSATALQGLLIDMIANPDSHSGDQALLAAIKSQGALARYVNGDRGISAMALNTQKLITNSYLDGFAKLDQLRRQALAAVTNAQSRNRAAGRRSKADLHLKLKEQKALLHTLDADLGLMTDAVAKLITCARSFAEEVGTDETRARWKRELRLIEAGLALQRKPLPASNITDIRAAHARKKTI